MVFEGLEPVLLYYLDDFPVDNNNNNNEIQRPTEGGRVEGPIGDEIHVFHVDSLADAAETGTEVVVIDGQSPALNVTLNEVEEIIEEGSAYGRRLSEAGREAVLAIDEIDLALAQNAAEQRREAAIIVHLNRATFIRDIKLSSLWSFAEYAKLDLQMDELMECRVMFVVTHTEPETHPLLKKAFDMVKLSSVRSLVLLSHRFHVRINEIDDQMDRMDRPVVEFGGWREEADEESNQRFVNEEGLIRVDFPNGWANEEFTRDNRFEEGRMDISNTEGFVLDRVDKLLAKISEEFNQCNQLAREIREEMAINYNQELADARDIEIIVETICAKTLHHFFYDITRAVPILPTFGITHAYHQRMARCRPNYIIELEEYFNDEENC